MKSADELRSEFDEVAIVLAKKGPVRASRLRRRMSVLKLLPPDCKQVLDIGCGLGNLARMLAQHVEHVLAVDLSPEMIRIARERSDGIPNVEYRVEDVMTWEFPAQRFDCVTSIMTLHHMPLEAILVKIKPSLRQGGILIVRDLYQPTGWRKAAADVAAFMRRRLKRFLRYGSMSSGNFAWKHDTAETYLSIGEIRAIYQRVLPGAKVSEDFRLQRYSVTWTKP